MTNKADWSIAMDGDLIVGIIEKLDKIAKKIESNSQKLEKLKDELKDILDNDFIKDEIDNN